MIIDDNSKRATKILNNVTQAKIQRLPAGGVDGERGQVVAEPVGWDVVVDGEFAVSSAGVGCSVRLGV